MDRRQLLSGIGVAAATITSPAVAAARGRKGPPEHAGPPEQSNAPDHAGPISFENNQFKINHRDNGQGGKSGGQSRSSRSNNEMISHQEQYERSVDAMNEALDRGLITVVDEDETEIETTKYGQKVIEEMVAGGDE